MLWSEQVLNFQAQEIHMSKNIEINEMDTANYLLNWLKAAHYIENVVRVKRKKVFVYCTSGVSRAPSVIMTYLAYFKQVERYDDLQYIEDLLALFHPGSLPNAEAVALLLENNQSSWMNVTPNP